MPLNLSRVWLLIALQAIQVYKMNDQSKCINETQRAFQKLKLRSIPTDILILIIEKLDFDDALVFANVLKFFPKRYILQYHNFSFDNKWDGSSMKNKIFQYCKSSDEFKALVLNKKVLETVPGWGLVGLAMEARDLECVKMVLNLDKITHQDCEEAWDKAQRLSFPDAIDYLTSNYKMSDSRNHDFSRASLNGNIHEIQSLLSDSTFNPYTVDMNYWCPVVIAAQKGHEQIVRLLLQDSRVCASADYNEALRCSSKGGHANIVKMLLSHPTIDPNSCRRGQQWNEHFEPILTASERGFTEVIRHLLDDQRTDPSICSNRAIYWACANGHIEIVRLLLSDERVDPNDPADGFSDVYVSEKLPLSAAAAKGNLEIVRLLLSDERVDPLAKDDQAIIMASYNGHADIVRLILDAAVDRILCNTATDQVSFCNRTIILASEHGYADIVELLLLEGHANECSEAINTALEHGHDDIAKLLILDGRFDPSAHDNVAIIRASECGYTEIVELLLSDFRADPAVRSNEPIIRASRNGHYEIVKLLLSDSRTNPFDQNNLAIRDAEKNGFDQIVNLLYSQQKLNSSLKESDDMRNGKNERIKKRTTQVSRPKKR